MDENANIEAALQPRLRGQDRADVISAQAEMVPDHGDDGRPLGPQPTPQALGGALVVDGKKEIRFRLGG